MIEFRLILKMLFVDRIHLGMVMRGNRTYIQIYFNWFFIIKLFVWLLSLWFLYFSFLFIKRLLFYWLNWSFIFSLFNLFALHILYIKIFFHTSFFYWTWLQNKLVFLLLYQLSLKLIGKGLRILLILRILIWLYYI